MAKNNDERDSNTQKLQQSPNDCREHDTVSIGELLYCLQLALIFQAITIKTSFKYCYGRRLQSNAGTII